MNMPLKDLHVVDMAEMKILEGQKRTFYNNTHPELASLSELVADFPAEERPLISNLGEKISVIDDSPLVKVDIDNAVLGEFKPIEHTFLYKLLLSFSLLVMTSAVAIYVVLLGGAGYVVYNKVLGYLQHFSSAGIYNVVSSCLFAVFGILLLIGMIKAVAMRSKRKAVYEISIKEEPVFFHYLETICKNLSTEMPHKIYVSREIEAECTYKNLFSSKYNLYLGLPLVEGFSTKELSGILAHELCRYKKQGSFLVERVRKFYIWLGELTCHQDKLDKYIYSLNQKMKKNPLRFLLLIAELFFKIPRLILRGLMWGVYLLCQFAIHTIDYEGEYYEVQFAGNKKFEEIAYNMEMMSQTLSNIKNGFDKSQLNQNLHDDLPGYVAATAVRLNEDKQKIIEKFNQRKESITAINPSFKKRMEKTDKFHCIGIFNLEQPSKRLFLQLNKYRRNISIEQYKIHFGKKGVTLSEIKATDNDFGDIGELAHSLERIENYFHGTVPFEKITVVDRKYPLNAKNWIQALRNLKKVHESLKNALPDIERIQEKHEKSASLKRLLICTKDFFSHNPEKDITINVLSRRVNRKNVAGLLENVSREVSESEAKLNEFYSLCSARLCFAIQLLNRKEFRAKVKDGEIYRKNLSHILQFLRIFDHIKTSLVTLRNGFIEAGSLIESNPHNHEFENGLTANRVLLQKSLKVVGLKLREIPYPFGENSKMTIMDFVGFEVPESGDYKALLYVAEEIYEKSTAVYFKVLAELIFIAEHVEESAGLESEFTSDHRFSLRHTCG